MINNHVKMTLYLCSIGALGAALIGVSIGEWTGLGVALGLSLIGSAIAVGAVYGNT